MTGERRYPWKRFWCSREGRYGLADDGYLVDPDDSFGRHVHDGVVPFDAIREVSCLALLGEPGIGKTCAMEVLRRQLEEKAPDSPDAFLYLDLRSYSSELRLHGDLFGSAEVSRWMNGSYTLDILLDSLDECLIHIKTLAAMLVDELRKCPLSRMRLRIACRTAEWPRLLEDELPTLWGSGYFHAYELHPLRRSDVRIAAESEGLDADGFLTELRRDDLIPFAIRPITLRMLIEAKKGGRALPSSRSALYEEFCLQL